MTGGLPDYAAALSGLAHRRRAAGVLAVSGPDRVAFLQGQLTQDVRGIPAGHSLPVAGLSPKGKLLYFGRVVAMADRLLLLVPASRLEAVLAHLRKYAVFQKVTVADASHEIAYLGLYGPGAARIAAPEGGLLLPPEGEFAAAILAPSGSRSEVDRGLQEAGSVAVSPEAAEILRVEAGRPRFGTDADESSFPDELPLKEAISTTKGCYVGQEVVARIRTYGRIQRRLVGFRFPRSAVEPGAVFLDPDRPALELGRVTSAVLSPRFGPIGLGYAFREVREGGTLVSPERPDLLAVVAALPFA